MLHRFEGIRFTQTIKQPNTKQQTFSPLRKEENEFAQRLFQQPNADNQTINNQTMKQSNNKLFHR